VDFFVSYAEADQQWGEWIAWQLEEAGYSTRVQAWDFGAGSRFVHEMHLAAQEARRTVAVLSGAYLRSAYAETEWQAAWAADPSGRRRNLLAFRIEACDRPGLLRQVVSVDLFGLDQDAARARLLAVAAVQRGKPTHPPGFPGAPTTVTETARPGFPGLPPVWNVPGRLRTFTGRGALLDQISAGMAVSGGRVAVTALHGLGGVGKTQLAIEYAWRHAGAFQLVWWVNAEQAALVGEQLAGLAGTLGVTVSGDVGRDAVAVLERLRHRDGWLLIYDNAPDAEQIWPWLPTAGAGRVLITSRSPVWGGMATRVPVDVLDRPDALALLNRRIQGLGEGAGRELADELGDLPLALEQAAAYIEATGMPVARYLEKFRLGRAAMLGRGRDLAYRGTVDTCWAFALTELTSNDPAAAELLAVAAYYGPDPVPLNLLASHLADGELAAAVADDDLDEVVAAVRRFSLARRDGTTLQLHRLVAAVIRAHLTADQRAAAARQVRRQLRAACPGDPDYPATWPRWAGLASHLPPPPPCTPTRPPTTPARTETWCGR
jgi:hypothetical protein